VLDYWDFRRCPSSGILKNAAFQRPDLFPSSDKGVGDTQFLGPLERAGRSGCFLPQYLETETDADDPPQKIFFFKIPDGGQSPKSQ
jgi:hypothetical protein